MSDIDSFKSQRLTIKEHLSNPLEQRDSKMSVDDREISGYAIVWGSVNDYREMVMRGATLKSLNARGVNSTAGNKIQLLLQHDTRQILGRLVELREDEYGLFFRAEISSGIGYCDDTLKQIREDLLKQLSYGFNYVWDESSTVYDEERDIYILNEIVLHELSLVTFSSDPSAQLRSNYAQGQMMQRLSQYSQTELNGFIKAIEIYTRSSSIADEATNESVIESITSKF